MKTNLIVVGGGLVGSLLSIFLARRGYTVDLYESRLSLDDPYIGHRSINLAIAERGKRALEAVGLADRVLANTINMPGRMVHHSSGELEFQPYGIRSSESLHAHSRGWLNKLLVETAVATGRVKVHYGYRVQAMDFRKGRLTLLHTESDQIHFASGVVFACDGSSSVVRDDMIKLPWFEFSQTHYQGDVRFAYMNLEIPPEEDGTYRMEKNALHVWPGQSRMFLALPDSQGSFAGNLFLPSSGPDSWEELATTGARRALVEKSFPDIPALIPNLDRQLAENPVGLLTTIHCSPWYVQDKAVLLGDAAHSMVPFFGQGMNCGFEDCQVMDQLVGQYGPDWERVFREFQAARLENGRAISDMSLENFIEMRAETDSPLVGLRKAVDHHLERNFPERYIGRYSLIVHHTIAYSLARQIGEVQKGILDELCLGINKPEEVDLQRAERFIANRLDPLMQAAVL